MIDGWRIYFLRKLFGKQCRDLRAEVRSLKLLITCVPSSYQKKSEACSAPDFS